MKINTRKPLPLKEKKELESLIEGIDMNGTINETRLYSFAKSIKRLYYLLYDVERYDTMASRFYKMLIEQERR